MDGRLVLLGLMVAIAGTTARAVIFFPIGIVGFTGAAMSLPVEILGRLQPATSEALVLSLEQRASSRVRVELVLAEGGRAHASLDSFGLAWLGLRAGDIVWVRPLTTGPRFSAAPGIPARG